MYNINSILVLTDTVHTPLNEYDPLEKMTSPLDLKKRWKEKLMRGKYIASIERSEVDTKAQGHFMKLRCS